MRCRCEPVKHQPGSCFAYFRQSGIPFHFSKHSHVSDQSPCFSSNFYWLIFFFTFYPEKNCTAALVHGLENVTATCFCRIMSHNIVGIVSGIGGAAVFTDVVVVAHPQTPSAPWWHCTVQSFIFRLGAAASWPVGLVWGIFPNVASALMEVMKVCHQAVVDLRSPKVKKKRRGWRWRNCSLQTYKDGNFIHMGVL